MICDRWAWRRSAFRGRGGVLARPLIAWDQREHVGIALVENVHTRPLPSGQGRTGQAGQGRTGQDLHCSLWKGFSPCLGKGVPHPSVKGLHRLEKGSPQPSVKGLPSLGKGVPSVGNAISIPRRRGPPSSGNGVPIHRFTSLCESVPIPR